MADIRMFYPDALGQFSLKTINNVPTLIINGGEAKGEYALVRAFNGRETSQDEHLKEMTEIMSSHSVHILTSDIFKEGTGAFIWKKI